MKDKQSKSFFAKNWYYFVLGICAVIFGCGIFSLVRGQNNKFQDTYSVMTALPKKANLKSINGNFQSNFKNGAVIKQIDNKKDLMRTSYVFDSGVIPTGRVIINTVEKVSIVKKGKKQIVKPTGELVALSASSNSVEKSTAGFSNKKAQIEGSKDLISREVGYIVNANNKSLINEIKKNCEIVKTKQGNEIVELESKNMKHTLVSNFKSGTPKNEKYTFEDMYLIANTNKIRKANEKQIVTTTNLYGRYN